jgi:hypothetical protein
MDERLKEVRQTDLTEGRINEDFLDWLRTKGVSWLLVLMVALCVYFGILRWRNHKLNFEAEGWDAFTKATTPGPLEEVADKYAGVDSLPTLARLRAAQFVMNAVQAEQTLPTADGAPTVSLQPTDRTAYLDRADRLYTAVLGTKDAGASATLMMVTAFNGRAAVAESRGQLDEARAFYEQAAKQAEAEFPLLAQQARDRASNIDQDTRVASLPTAAEAAIDAQPGKGLDPVQVDPWISNLLFGPPESGG